MNKQEIFDNWWVNQNGQNIATRIYGDEAEQNILPKLQKLPTFTPEDNTYESNTLEAISNNIFWDEVQRLAKENNLHLN